MPDIRPTVRLTEHGDLIAAVPHLLGFYPQRSLVVIALAPRANGTLTIAACLRSDLPVEQDPQLPDLAALLARPLRNVGASHALLLVVTGPGGQVIDSPPERPGVRVVSTVLEDAGICVRHMLWTHEISAGQPWACYESDGCAGRLPDPASSVMAAHHVAAGYVTYPDRAALQRLLAPAAPDVLARRAQWLAALDPITDAGRAFDLVHRAVERDAPPATEPEYLALGHALGHQAVFEASLSLTHGQIAPAAKQLWQTLTRELPAPHQSAAATLYGIATYLEGDGASAGIAFDLALQADPTNRLAQLLATALTTGLPAEDLQKLVTEEGEHARNELRRPHKGGPASPGPRYP